MAARFEISSQGTGKFNWALRSQGRTLATGESYARRALAEKAIESLRKAAAGATVADLTVKPKAPTAKKTARTTKAAAPAKAAGRVAKTAKPAAKATAKAAKPAAKAATKAVAAAKRPAKKTAVPRKRISR